MTTSASALALLVLVAGCAVPLGDYVLFRVVPTIELEHGFGVGICAGVGYTRAPEATMVEEHGTEDEAEAAADD